MERLPNEVLITEILSSMSLPEILKNCLVNLRFARICRGDELWRGLTLRDFPYESVFNRGLSWKEYYINVYQSPVLPVYRYDDPIEWVRLTPYNLTKVIGLIQGLAPESKIVFVDIENQPLASFSEGQFNVLDPLTPMRKIVLLSAEQPLTIDSILSNLTTSAIGGLPTYGYMFDDGTWLVGYLRLRRSDEVPGEWCHELTAQELNMILTSLKLQEELDPLNWGQRLRVAPNTQTLYVPSDVYDELCPIILNRLRSMGRILNEVALPNKPLLENVSPSPSHRDRSLL